MSRSYTPLLLVTHMVVAGQLYFFTFMGFFYMFIDLSGVPQQPNFLTLLLLVSGLETPPSADKMVS
jgi:hypothetical protein